jgi:hypothetical protein
MSKHTIVMVMAVIALACFASFGCGGGGGGTEPTRAMDIEDGSEKYFPRQYRCPVCGNVGLSKDQYVDIDGKRLYFDRAQCIDDFEQDRQKYLKRLQNQMLAPPGEGPGELGAKAKQSQDSK